MELIHNLMLKMQQDIISGVFNDVLPPIRLLAQHYNVGESTMKLSLKHLKENGFLIGQQGKCISVNPLAINNHFFQKNIIVYIKLPRLGLRSSDAIDLDVCKDVLITNCNISVNDDAIALKGGKGPDADKLPENGGNYNVVIENCTFGFCHCILTCGSETIHNKNIIVRNCVSDGAACLLSLKMRPDTNQLNEDILVENISGYCKRIFSSYSFTQFRRSPNLHMSYGKNITLQNLNLRCDKLITAEKSIEYKLDNIIVRNCNFECKEQLNIDFNEGKDFVIENVKINPIS